MEPLYIDAYRRGVLKKVSDELNEGLSSCILCPRRCKVNRLKDEKGFCDTGRNARISSFFLHFGEEKELVGKGGSGTIFFSGCNLKCLYCQNYEVSCMDEGKETDAEGLAKIMMYLQNNGCHNINFVTPTHVIANIVEALMIAVPRGLNVPLVYNCGGYESPSVIRKLAGIMDIYMPDVKYSDSRYAEKFSQAPDYWDNIKPVLVEMNKQVGPLQVTVSRIAQRGLMIRHLVLPSKVSGSFKVLDFIKENLPHDTYISIMDQYRPCYKADKFREISRTITFQEYKEVVEYALRLGLKRVIHGSTFLL